MRQSKYNRRQPTTFSTPKQNTGNRHRENDEDGPRQIGDGAQRGGGDDGDVTEVELEQEEEYSSW